MLHQIDAHRFSNAYEHREPKPSDCALYYEDRQALLLTGFQGQLLLPTFDLLLPSHPHVMNGTQYLFDIDGRGFFLVDCIRPNQLEGATLQQLEVFRSFTPQHMGFAGIIGSQLYRFYLNNAFCGRCGAPMRKSQTERAMVCGACENTVYPKLSPAVIVAITDGNRLLMTKYAGRVFTRYALVAGFAEFGEPIERTVEREVREEVGLKIRNIRYFSSQPWPFSDSLLFGFFCDLDGGDTVTLGDGELAEATWFQREDIPQAENTMSLTSTMIETFRRGERV